MKQYYKDAINKITVSDDFENSLKTRLAREKVRVDNTSHIAKSKLYMRISIAAATAAIIVLTVISSSFVVPTVIENGNRSDNSLPAVQTSTKDTYVGYKTISLANDMSYRLTSASDTIINYDTKIYFTFKGFDKYNVDIYESCILFNTALSSKYTLANFFDDYYSLITNSLGMSTIDNGLLTSIFDLTDSSLKTIRVYDDSREIIDLDYALLSDYAGMDEIHFTISIT